jgi:hypothetical protein
LMLTACRCFCWCWCWMKLLQLLLPADEAAATEWSCCCCIWNCRWRNVDAAVTAHSKDARCWACSICCGFWCGMLNRTSSLNSRIPWNWHPRSCAHLTAKKLNRNWCQLDTDWSRNRISARELGMPFCSTRFTDGKWVENVRKPDFFWFKTARTLGT